MIINLETLRTEAARGGGETLLALAAMYGRTSPQASDDFENAIRENFELIFYSARSETKPVDIIAGYLKIDEDGDFVLLSAPCPFLDAENYCTVYNDRPAACR